MRILIITHHRLWRAAYRSRVIAERMVRRGHEVTLIVTADEERWRWRRSRINGVDIVEAPDLTFGSLRAGWDLVAALRRDRWLRRNAGEFDLVHLFETRPATVLPGLAAANRMGVPLVTDWVDSWGRGGAIRVKRPLWYQILFAWYEVFFEEHFRHRADATTVICYGLIDRAVSVGVPRDTILHVRNGADLEKFTPWPMDEARARLGLPQGPFLVGYSAQDSFYDLDAVFHGFRRLLDTGADARLVLTGYAPKRVGDLAAKLGIADRLDLVGYLSWDDYPYFLAACNVLVAPFPDTEYNRGRWPGKFGDYLAAGRPIVFNPSGDLKDFAGQDAPGIACAFSAEGFGDAFAELYRDPRRAAALGERAREIACTEMDWEMIIDRFEGMYQRLVSELVETPKENAIAVKALT